MLVKDRILLERKRQDISCSQLAQAIGMHKGTVNRYENGTIKRIPTHILQKISDAIHVPFDELISEDPLYFDLLDQKQRKQENQETSDAEQELLLWYRTLSPEAQSYLRQILKIKPTI